MDNERKVRNFLMQLGCRITLKGFRYLLEAVKLTCRDEEAIFNLSTNVFAKVSEKYGTTNDNIERDIHTVLINAWNSDAGAIQNIAVKKTKHAPTVKEFVGIITNHLKFSDQA